MLNISDYRFDGPYSINAGFNELAGVYVITTAKTQIIDVGETENLKERIPNHERRLCWIINKGEKLYFLRESNYSIRLDIEKKIRIRYNPTCGDQ